MEVRSAPSSLRAFAYAVPLYLQDLINVSLPLDLSSIILHQGRPSLNISGSHNAAAKIFDGHLPHWNRLSIIWFGFPLTSWLSTWYVGDSEYDS